MAVETGTASNAQDLYDKLIAFLTTNADLVAADQEWAVAWDSPAPDQNQSDIVLRGPGLAGQDQVYVGMRLYQDPIGDTFFIQTRGMTGVLPNGQHYSDHVNVTPNYVRMFLDVATMQYWFVANGRRFMVVVKISTNFETMYAGLFLPYATPLSYPYPFFLGGSAGPIDSDGPFNWRSEDTNHSHFAWPVNENYYSSQAVDANAWLLDPAGSWKRLANSTGTAGTPCCIGPEYAGGTDYFPSQWYDPRWIMTRTMDAYGGDRILVPCTLIQKDPTDQTYGILDGAFRCQGVGNSAENLITVDGVDHLVVQNVYRSDFNDYWAMALEE
jgi:hypothetical protein